jgi:hypothetical protein
VAENTTASIGNETTASNLTTDAATAREPWEDDPSDPCITDFDPKTCPVVEPVVVDLSKYKKFEKKKVVEPKVDRFTNTGDLGVAFKISISGLTDITETNLKKKVWLKVPDSDSYVRKPPLEVVAINHEMLDLLLF